jgi:hypothetical protein
LPWAVEEKMIGMIRIRKHVPRVREGFFIA